MYRYLHLHKNAPKKTCAHTTRTCIHAHSLTNAQLHINVQLCSCTHSLTDSLTHSVIHSLTHSFTRSHIFTLFNSHSLFVTSMFIQAHSNMLMHILTLTHNDMYTWTNSIMRSYNLILSYINSHARAHTHLHTHRVYVHV